MTISRAALLAAAYLPALSAATNISYVVTPGSITLVYLGSGWHVRFLE